MGTALISCRARSSTSKVRPPFAQTAGVGLLTSLTRLLLIMMHFASAMRGYLAVFALRGHHNCQMS